MATRGVNHVTILGRLGDDPELRKTNNDVSVCNLSVATSETWKDKNDKDQEETEWHRLVFFRKLADIACQYCKKGDQIFVEGKLKTRSWEDRETGKKQYSTEIIVNNLQLLGNSKSSTDESSVRVPL